MIWHLILFLTFLMPEFTEVKVDSDKASLWKVSASSNIKVHGQSNVNEFQCVTIHYKGDDKLIKKRNGFYNLNELIGTISMDVHSFDCENRIMTRDLRETMEADAYPNISISILSLLIPEVIERNGQFLKGKAEITIAGNSQLVDLNWRVIPENDQKIRLLSTRDFSFTQFGLTPPTKMMGMIRVKDKLQVDIDLAIEKISEDE